jgi:hypothetical protein
MANGKYRPINLKVEQLERRDAPSVTPVSESFDTTATGALPPGWTQWDSRGQTPYEVSPAKSYSPARSLAVTTNASDLSARTWHTTPQDADVEVSASVFLGTVIPTELIARGKNLDGPSPSYYALSIIRGVRVQLVRVTNGTATVLAQLDTPVYYSQQWVRATFRVQGSQLKAQVFRPDTSQFLDASGNWTTTATWALQTNDWAVAGGGHVGLGRPPSHAGTVYVDDFRLFSAQGDTQRPSARVVPPLTSTTLRGTQTFGAVVSDNVAVASVEFHLDGQLRSLGRVGPYSWTWDTSTAVNGPHTLKVIARDLAGNATTAWYSFHTDNPTALPVPTVPRHYSHIRVAQLAYSGTPFSSFEDRLLRESVDLVVAGNDTAVNRVSSVSPSTPDLMYGNVSSVYKDTLLSWLNHADGKGVSREEAFYHVDRAAAFSGTSASSQPVGWFWKVYRGASTYLNYTNYATGTQGSGVGFGQQGESLYLGYLERFREINFDLVGGARNGWAGVVEYATSVDFLGRATGWAALPTLSDTTAGFTRSGQITFAPPAGWKAGSVSDTTRLFYVRVRTVTGGSVPLARSITGRDYTASRGGTSGVVPAFDAAADRDGDGYLNESEWASRAAGKDARFRYESRAFYRDYGQMRFATNPDNGHFRQWVVDYFKGYLDARPKAGGLFVDNSGGISPVTGGTTVRESLANYAADYGSLLNTLARAIGPRWVLLNSAGGGTTADAVIQYNSSYYEEFSIRALAHSYKQFEDVAGMVSRRSMLRTPPAFAVIDAHPHGGSPTDARTQLATLAYYYMFADPTATFLNPFGGIEPGTSWTRHWFDALAYNVGSPQGAFSEFATGQDPTDTAYTYKVYQRRYANALVLYKPVSYGNYSTGSIGDATATTHSLGGSYRPVRADGTLGAAVTSVTLRNGEGAILVRA